MDPEEKRKQLELDILQIIEAKLATGEMDLERAKAISRLVLDKLHPPLTLEQIYRVAPILDDEFGELSMAVLPFMEEHDEKLRQVVAEHAEKLIKSGKFEEADTILKQELSK